MVNSCHTFQQLLKLLSCVWLFATPWTVAYQAPLSMGFPRQEYWSGLPFPSPGDLPDPGIKPRSLALQADRRFTIWATRDDPMLQLSLCNFTFYAQCSCTWNHKSKAMGFAKQGSAFESKLLLSFFTLLKTVIQGYCCGIVRYDEFMPHIPTTAHLWPTQQWRCCFSIETLSYTSTPDPYNQEIQVALKLNL